MANNQHIRVFYLNNFFLIMTISFFNPILYLYLLNHHSMQEIGLYLAIFWIVTFLTEVPCGFITDKIGEKRSLYLSALFRMLGLLMLLSDHYLLLLCSGVFSGVSESFQSGTLGSWLVNALKSEDQTSHLNLDKIFSSSSLIGMTTSLCIGFLSAEFLYPIAYELPIICSALSCFLQLYGASRLTDYKGARSVNWKETMNEFKYSVKEIKGIFKKLFLVNNAFIMVAFLIQASILDIGPSNQWQVVFHRSEGVSLTGIMWVIITVSGMIGSLIAEKVLANHHRLQALFILVVTSIILVGFMASPLDIMFKIGLFSLYIMLNTIIGIKISSFLHHEFVDNDTYRNTIISVYYALESIVVSCVLWANGLMSEKIGVLNTWMVISLLAFLIVTVCYLHLSKNNKITREQQDGDH